MVIKRLATEEFRRRPLRRSRDRHLGAKVGCDAREWFSGTLTNLIIMVMKHPIL
jgi:hypothetical protein